MAGWGAVFVGVDNLSAQTDRGSGGGGGIQEKWERIYRFRAQLYSCVLLFIVFAGMPQLLVPAWRARLRDRLHHLRAALSGVPKGPEPVFLALGSNTEPFPAQYERPIERLPQFEPGRIFPMVPTIRAGSGAAVQPMGDSKEAADSSQAVGTDTGNSQGRVGEPEFRQGTAEQAAYEILLQNHATLSTLVKGSDPKFRFRAWGAARIDDDTFYVRVVFVPDGGTDEAVYVWQVKPNLRSISPLNYNARALALKKD